MKQTPITETGSLAGSGGSLGSTFAASPDILRDFASLQADVAALNKGNVDLANENARLREEINVFRAWIGSLDVLAENNEDRRNWHGSDVGWVYPGHAAYYGIRREDILSNDQGEAQHPAKKL